MPKPLFHHCTELHNVFFGVVEPSVEDTRRHIPADDFEFPNIVDSYIRPNLWLQEQTGFYPLFLAVGETVRDIGMTGYQNQWLRILGYIGHGHKNVSVPIRVQKGRILNRVLFSFNDVKGVFVDYDWWFMVLNGEADGYQVSEFYRRRILKPSYKRSDWLRKARKDPCSVMCVVPKLDLRKADRIWVRNKPTRKLLKDMGFSNIEVQRIPVDS